LLQRVLVRVLVRGVQERVLGLQLLARAQEQEQEQEQQLGLEPL
jgi:hypothetical protein